MDYKKTLSSVKSNVEAYSKLPNLLEDVIRQGYYERLYNLIYYTVLDNQRHEGVGEPLKIILNKAVDQVVEDLQKSSKISIPKLQTKKINYNVDVDPVDRPQTERKTPKPMRKFESKPFESITALTARTWSSIDSRGCKMNKPAQKKAYTFNKEKRFPANKNSPGPGDYDATEAHRDKSPKTIFNKQQRKSKFDEDNRSPGPGEYDPIDL